MTDLNNDDDPNDPLPQIVDLVNGSDNGNSRKDVSQKINSNSPAYNGGMYDLIVYFAFKILPGMCIYCLHIGLCCSQF